MPDEVVCPMPRGVTHEQAREVYAKVRKEMRGVTDSAIRREAARRMGLDYDTYLKAWKKPTVKPVVPEPVTPIPTPAPQPTIPPPLTYETARAQAKLVKKEFPHFTEAQVRREAARRMGIDYDTYLRAWKKPKDYTPPKPNVPHVPSPTIVKPPPAPVVDEKYPLKFKRKEVKALTDGSDSLVRKPGFAQGDFEYHDDSGYFAWIYKAQHRYEVRLKGRPGSTFYDTLEEAEAYVNKIKSGDLPDHMVINPGRAKGVSGTTKNCPSTTSAWELRRRGYDVVAGKLDNGAPINHIYDAWGIGYDNVITRGRTPVSLLETIPQGLWDIKKNALPDGARGFITVVWKRGGAHIFNWEKRDGEIWYIDAQVSTETRGPSGWASRAEDGIYIARVDNIKETPKVEWLVSEGEQKRLKNPYYDY